MAVIMNKFIYIFRFVLVIISGTSTYFLNMKMNMIGKIADLLNLSYTQSINPYIDFFWGLLITMVIFELFWCFTVQFFLKKETLPESLHFSLHRHEWVMVLCGILIFVGVMNVFTVELLTVLGILSGVFWVVKPKAYKN